MDSIHADPPDANISRQPSGVDGPETARPKRLPTLQVETLEQRILLSATWGDGVEDAEGESSGEPVTTITGSSNNDTLYGTAERNRIDGESGDDTIHGYAGDDILIGGGDNDHLYGGDGHDLVDGGEGNDHVIGGDGDDVLLGGEGNDEVEGGRGNDVAFGGAGNDKLRGGRGDDVLHGEEGNDELYGNAGNDTLHGGEGNDTLRGGSGDDVLHGGEGNDTLYGNAGNDLLHGGAGNDTLRGGAGHDTLAGDEGNDSLYGGAGDDVLRGGSGKNLLDGGRGYDTADYSDAEGPVTVDLTYGDHQQTGVSEDKLVGIEAVIGSDHDDTFAFETHRPGAAYHVTGGDGHNTIDLSGFNSADVQASGGRLIVTQGDNAPMTIEYSQIQTVRFADGQISIDHNPHDDGAPFSDHPEHDASADTAEAESSDDDENDDDENGSPDSGGEVTEHQHSDSESPPLDEAPPQEVPDDDDDAIADESPDADGPIDADPEPVVSESQDDERNDPVDIHDPHAELDDDMFVVIVPQPDADALDTAPQPEAVVIDEAPSPEPVPIDSAQGGETDSVTISPILDAGSHAHNEPMHVHQEVVAADEHVESGTIREAPPTAVATQDDADHAAVRPAPTAEPPTYASRSAPSESDAPSDELDWDGTEELRVLLPHEDEADAQAAASLLEWLEQQRVSDEFVRDLADTAHQISVPSFDAGERFHLIETGHDDAQPLEESFDGRSFEEVFTAADGSELNDAGASVRLNVEIPPPSDDAPLEGVADAPILRYAGRRPTDPEPEITADGSEDGAVSQRVGGMHSADTIPVASAASAGFLATLWSMLRGALGASISDDSVRLSDPRRDN